VRQWNHSLPALRKALSQRFPEADPDTIDEWADEIYSACSAAATLEGMEHGDKPASRDINDLEAAAKNLRLAASKLEKLGWHGSTSLLEFSKALKKVDVGFAGEPLMDALEASGYAAQHLSRLANRIEDCASEIDRSAGSVLEAFGGKAKRSSGRGARTKTEAYFTAREAYDAFAALAQKAPSVTTKTNDNTASGPFFDFVCEVFDFLSVDASPETWARLVCREKKATKQ